MTLGERIRRTRTQRDLTLEKLAQSTGLTISFLSQVERNAVSPSVESLQKIARALSTRVGAFFEEEEAKELTLVRKAQRRRAVDEKTRSTIETLASGLLNIKMEPRLLTLDVGGEIGEGLSAHGAEVFGFVLEGTVEVMRGKEERLSLEKGDSVYLKSPRPYKIVNGGSQQAQIMWIAFMAEV
jgi:transcriptional regulator with XRE-family HTH domain